MGKRLCRCIMLLIMYRMGTVRILTMQLIMILVILFIMHIIVLHTKYLQPWNMQPQVFLTSTVHTSIKLTL
jgi:1,4-dihydroxy-2-naphthoate octaprenyltransferase